MEPPNDVGTQQQKHEHEADDADVETDLCEHDRPVNPFGVKRTRCLRVSHAITARLTTATTMTSVAQLTKVSAALYRTKRTKVNMVGPSGPRCRRSCRA